MTNAPETRLESRMRDGQLDLIGGVVARRGFADLGRWSAVKRWSPGNCRTFGRKGAMSILTLNDCPACGLVETKTGGHPRCPDCGRRLGCEEPPERGDYDYDEAP